MKPDLKLIHDFFSQKNYENALPILENLVINFPEFNLYKFKLTECITKLNEQKSNINFDNKKGLIIIDNNSENSIQENKNTISYAIEQAELGNTPEARKTFNDIFLKNKDNIDVLVWLAKVDVIDGRFKDALYKAKKVISLDQECRDAYRIAEQAAIEIGDYDAANNFFLSQPKISNSVDVRKRGVNHVLPPQFHLPPIIGAGNDYHHILERASLFRASKAPFNMTVSIIITVFNQKEILANTLAALTHQTYPKSLTEIIIVDDGSCDDVLSVIKKYESKLNLYYLRQSDIGYRLAAARNLGAKCAKGDAIIFFDADILSLPNDVESYMCVLHVSDDSVLIGHRRYVDVTNINDDMIIKNISIAEELPSINPNNDVADRKNSDGVSVDWRYLEYEKSNYLINDLWPFTKAAGGNIAFSRRLFDSAGYFDEEFNNWGCEDGEQGYRFYNAGAYFIPMIKIISLHQEPFSEVKLDVNELKLESFRSKGHGITKAIFSQKCPAPVIRRYLPGLKFTIPKVSIYIPAFNAEKYIVAAINSCLKQNFDDLEVCICDDGSTDKTLELLKLNFENNPKVRWVTQINGGIGKATNTAIRLCKGMYIGQLDADDVLKPDAVKICVNILDNKNVDAVYGDCEYIDGDGKYIREGWCGGEYSREWMATGMIATHFRMFRKRVWSRVSSCNENIKNAVDFDLWLKIYEKGNIEHIHQILYSYRWHGENTSIMHRKQQEKNHLNVVQESLKRLQLDKFWAIKNTDNKINPREFKIIPVETNNNITPHDVVFLIPTCTSYSHKMIAVRNSWAKNLQELGFRYLFLIGNPEVVLSEVVDDVLYVPCKDDYESLLLKLTLGYDFIYTNMDFSYIYKIDDDCYPNLKKLVNEILPQLVGRQYLGGATHAKGVKINNQWHFGKCSNSRFDKPYRFDVAPVEFAKGGYGYFLRKDILPIIFECKDIFKSELLKYIYSYEDVRIAEILSLKKIYPFKLNGYSVVLDGNAVNFKTDMLVFDIKNVSTFSRLLNY